MPRVVGKHQHNIQWELEVLAVWKKKTSGITSYEWDGNELVVLTATGREVFDRHTVEAVIFSNFGRNV